MPNGRKISRAYATTPWHTVTIAVSCEGVIKRLGVLLAPWPLPPHATCDSPMSATALRALRDSPSDADPIDLTYLAPMRRILGCIGFIVVTVRCDAYFAYCVLSRYVNDRRMTALVGRLVLRLAHYVVATIHLHLHLARVSVAAMARFAWTFSSATPTRPMATGRMALATPVWLS